MLSSVGEVWVGRGMSALVVVFLLAASVAPKLTVSNVATDTLTSLGWPARFTFTIGVIELVCIVFYVVPRTSVLGAVLLTGLLGGALATHLRVGSPLFTHVLFSVYVGLFVWGGLWLRDPTLRAIFPFRLS